MDRRKQRSPRRDKSEVSCIIKYLMFGFNVLFWIIGILVLGVGIWAWAEKNTFNNINKLTNVKFDPALFFIIVGAIVFIIGFSGCVGALRENTKLLMFFCVVVGLLFFVQLLAGILGFVYKNWVRDQIETQVRNMIINYRKDPDLQNLIDWVQEDWLHCCGVDNYRDWELNRYFNCSSPGAEACGVPFSCCKPTQEVIQNRHCGFDIMKAEHDSVRSTKIYTTGCIPSGEQWIESNLIPVAAVLVGLAVLQILGICFAHNLRSDIEAQKAKWGT